MKFKVYGYDLSDVMFEIRSAGSLKLDIRLAAKEFPLYFKPVSKYVSNIGQALFGTPKFKGLFSMIVDKEDTEKKKSDITIYLDNRTSLFLPEEIKDMKEIIKKGLETLKKERVIEDYEEVKQ